MEAKESNGHLSDYSEDFEDEQESEVRGSPDQTAAPRDGRAKPPAEPFRRNAKSHSVAREHTGSKSYKGKAKLVLLRSTSVMQHAVLKKT